jgi:acetyl esterase/lipase
MRVMSISMLTSSKPSLNGPSSCRPTVAKLAELTKARCVVTGYRLAPQNPFPAALLDILVAYISLVYPPAGSFHEPIAASSIVIAAESAGASLALSLVQVLLAAKRSQAVDIPTVCFHGSKIPLRCPAGLTCLSTVPTQLPDVFPSFRTKASVDIFSDLVPCLRPDYPPCSIWPSNPPREHYYCEASVICHPLVSPVTARSWKGSPPMWFATGGEERCSDPTKVVAQAAARQGVVVRWEQYEAMPHIWMMLVKNWWQSMMVGRHWAETCQSFATGKELESKGQLIDLGKGELEVDVMTLTDLSPEGAESLMNQRVVSMKPWIGKQDAKASL